MASKAVTSKQPVLGGRDISVQWAVLQNAGGGEESRQAFANSTDTSKQPGTNAGSKNIQGAPPLGESAGAGQGVPPPPPKEKFKVIDTAALLKKRKAIKTKQDAVKKKLHDQKQALVRKQIDTYKAMLAKMATATGGGTAASNTKLRFQLIAKITNLSKQLDDGGTPLSPRLKPAPTTPKNETSGGEIPGPVANGEKDDGSKAVAGSKTGGLSWSRPLRP